MVPLATLVFDQLWFFQLKQKEIEKISSGNKKTYSLSLSLSTHTFSFLLKIIPSLLPLHSLIMPVADHILLLFPQIPQNISSNLHHYSHGTSSSFSPSRFSFNLSLPHREDWWRLEIIFIVLQLGFITNMVVDICVDNVKTSC